MSLRIIPYSHKIKGDLDDHYTLFEDGSILHEYGAYKYPGGYNLTKNYTVNELNIDIKKRFFEVATPENKEVAKYFLVCNILVIYGY